MEALDLVIHTLPVMVKGALLTLKFAVASMALGLVVGLVVAIMRIGSNRLASGLAQGYVSLMRGTPLLVQMFVVYYGLPDLGITLDPTTAGIFTLTLNAGAYLSESMRGAILGIGRGQWAAAHSLGLTHVQTLRYIVCPQALRLAVPSLGNTLISLIKDTSLVSVITVTELLRSTQEVIAATFQPLPLYLAAAALYWVLSTLLTRLQGRVETRLSLPSTH
ncbi:amino acid ABC transporter permease [Burkholderia ambifaria]|jgi:cystine transport system permease protein|uniref:Putative glutamine transport system permease protein GlnP n=1 Tax=Burkholderia ambifaria (strain ATCC BAA-244 / DSM 16087 / CCUG 44356 / LMG 19182 / AMMD) TaxID=339670 RepID=Q0B7S1_BURCM|nr:MULTISPECIES: amino acid ABC transporter permease [Burkholderia]ABI89802.1 amino acid ABC transporter membrane protein, PAAT family [Burkholderia ambifaria AMMD]AJY23803.1 amino ABC transporter, permease, 3-TM region, His/Glu/Gln/Arg/opine family domain protein [Burkholderia ambifaria AMMD]ELK6209467.1 amino acid ABC transporter permease [Burkholderia ambifaria]MBR7930344.1 amino acid ABC transporter permease [Burkholderia ambifaria]MBR8226321.1 amino acid ABC transporter permease [Burkhold